MGLHAALPAGPDDRNVRITDTALVQRGLKVDAQTDVALTMDEEFFQRCLILLGFSTIMLGLVG